LKASRHNSALASIVMNERADDLVVKGYDRFLVKVAPIYRDPAGKWGRAHFYTASKVVGPWEFSTLVFNSIILSLMILILYVALYFDWLKKVLEKRITFRRSG
jgi:hypothetical protein